MGGRVLVPFRQQRMSGIVVDLHDRPPAVATKNVVSVLDSAPVLDAQLMRLGKWIADYYLAPVGEVFRTMLPLSAEFKRTILYRITEQGQLALHLGGMSGSLARARRTPEEQMIEFRVLDYLANRDEAREPSLRSSTHASRAVLGGMVRKKWITREDVSDARDAARLVRIAVLRSAENSRSALAPAGGDARRSTSRMNANQQTLIETLAAAGGELRSRPCRFSMFLEQRWARSSSAGSSTSSMSPPSSTSRAPSHGLRPLTSSSIQRSSKHCNASRKA